MTFNELISKYRTPIMGCAMIVIMLFHQPFIYDSYVDGVFHLFGYWGVEIFLFVSGFGIVYSLQRNDVRTYYRNRMRRLFMPCVIVGVCKLLLANVGFTELTHPNVILLVTNVYLWYIYAISVYYLLAPVLYRWMKVYPKLVFVIVCLFSYLCTYIPFNDSAYYLINHIGWVTARLPIFVFGMYVAMYPLKMKLGRVFLLSLLFLAICVVLKLGSVMVRFQWDIPYLNILLVFATPSMCILACIATHLFRKCKCDGVLEYIGKHSLELYLWHEFVYWNLYRNEMFECMNRYVLFLLAVGISFLLAWVTSHLIKHFTQFR